MRQIIDFFTADYRDGRVHISGKGYPAGYFAVHLLNQYYVNDTAARLSVYITYNWKITKALHIGYLNPRNLERAADEIFEILKVLPTLKPFELFDIASERNRIKELSSIENGELICQYFRCRSDVGKMEPGEAAFDLLPVSYDQELFTKAQEVISDILSTLRFYESIGDDITKAFKRLHEFANRLEEVPRLNENHLILLAQDIFKAQNSNIKTEYVLLKKTANSEKSVLAKRLCFDSYYSFILTDFYEGLHFGHYPKRCEVCKRYFLMQSARRQKYCSGYAPKELVGDEKIFCRKYAVRQKNMAKEKAVNHPVVDVYRKRCSCIRSEQSKSVISPGFAKKAKELAKDRQDRALWDDKYSFREYKEDMERDKLYSDVDKIFQ